MSSSASEIDQRVPSSVVLPRPQCSCATINLPMLDGTGNVYDLLNKFRNFVIAIGHVKQQMIRLTFPHLNCTVAD